MKYRNIKTGAVIDIRSKISGAWVPVEEPAKDPAPAPEEKPVKKAKAPAQKKGTKK